VVSHRRHGATERHAGAEIAEAADFHGEKLAVTVERKRGIDDIVARVVIADVRLVSGLRPFHWPADAARRPQHQDDLRIDGAAQAVGAADIAGDQPQLGFGYLERGAGDVVAEQPGTLEAAMQRVAAGAGIIDPSHAARLNRIGGHPVDDQTLFDDIRGSGKGGIHLGLIAGLKEIGFVVQAFAVELWSVGCEGVARRYDSRPRRILDNDTFGGVTRFFERFGDHHRDRITHMHHAVERNRRPRR